MCARRWLKSFFTSGKSRLWSCTNVEMCARWPKRNSTSSKSRLHSCSMSKTKKRNSASGCINVEIVLPSTAKTKFYERKIAKCDPEMERNSSIGKPQQYRCINICVFQRLFDFPELWERISVCQEEVKTKFQAAAPRPGIRP